MPAVWCFLRHVPCAKEGMLSFREQYWRYSLFALIVGLGLTILIELAPFFGGLLGAVTIYILLRRQMHFLTEHHHWRRSMAALLLTTEAILLFLVPLGLLAWMLILKLQHFVLDPQTVVNYLHHIGEVIQQKTGYDLWGEENLSSITSHFPKIAKAVLSGVMDIGVNMLVLVFVLYFMLIGGRRMESFCRDLLPFDQRVGQEVAHEIHLIVRSNAIGVPLLAVAQGLGAYVGYLIFGVHQAWFWAILTGCATVLPIVGTALIWVPIGIFLALEKQWGAAIGLELYGVLVITQIDNLGRFIMQKVMADIHPLITIFGVFIGLSLFGFIGVIFGPLLLAMFIFCVGLFKCRYLDQHADCRISSHATTPPSSE